MACYIRENIFSADNIYDRFQIELEYMKIIRSYNKNDICVSYDTTTLVVPLTRKIKQKDIDIPLSELCVDKLIPFLYRINRYYYFEHTSISESNSDTDVEIELVDAVITKINELDSGSLMLDD